MKSTKELLSGVSSDLLELQNRYTSGAIDFSDFDDYPFDCDFNEIINGIVIMFSSYQNRAQVELQDGRK